MPHLSRFYLLWRVKLQLLRSSVLLQVLVPFVLNQQNGWGHGPTVAKANQQNMGHCLEYLKQSKSGTPYTYIYIKPERETARGRLFFGVFENTDKIGQGSLLRCETRFQNLFSQFCLLRCETAIPFSFCFSDIYIYIQIVSMEFGLILCRC